MYEYVGTIETYDSDAYLIQAHFDYLDTESGYDWVELWDEYGFCTKVSGYDTDFYADTICEGSWIDFYIDTDYSNCGLYDDYYGFLVDGFDYAV